MDCTYVSGYHDLWYAPFEGAGSPTFARLGNTGPEGIRVNREYNIEDITSDALGPNTIVDGIYQGGNMEIEFVCQDLNTLIVQQFLHPFQSTPYGAAHTAVVQEDVGPVGRTACGVAGLLQARPRAGTSAATFAAGSPTAGQARQYRGVYIGPEVETLDNTLRAIPVRFRVYPVNTGTDSVPVWKHWTWVTVG